MPVRLTPAPDSVIPTKAVSMAEWDTDGPLEEHIDILVFLRTDTLEAARKAATRTIVQGSRTREEINEAAYLRALFDVQVKGWRLLDPNGAEIPYTPENLAALPWDVRSWLHDEILACGGSIATRNIVVRTDSGIALDYKSPDGVVGAEQESRVPDPA